MNSSSRVLSIVIPAYNEEKALPSIIERCLEARAVLQKKTSLTDAEIIVVNDGSSDRTGEIARPYHDRGQIKLISYEKNRGYGAAIKQGFGSSSGEFVGFLDADGTCDPAQFVGLFNNLEANKADISIGSRMGADSHMPVVRRVGNLLYVWLINWMGGSRVTDSASGMRVIRRTALDRIYPLPDGMNFTPAMSAKAVLDKDLKIVEMFMPYEERIGRSKLRVGKDGLIFLKTIFDIGLFYKPMKFFWTVAFILFVACLFYGMPLIGFYCVNGRILETDIYRILAIVVAGVLGTTVFLLGITADEVVSIFSGRPLLHERVRNGFLKGVLQPRTMAVFGALIAVGGIALNHEVIREYILYRTIRVHWLYVATGALWVLVGAEIVVAAFLQKLLLMYQEVLRFRNRST